MALTFDKLIKYDLIDHLESKMRDPDSEIPLSIFFDFHNIYQQIKTVDQFIIDCPAYPRSTDKILRDELISSVGATLAIEGTSLTKDEIAQSFDKADLQQRLINKEQESANTREAYNYIIELVRSCEGEFVYEDTHIKQIHQYLTTKVDYIGNVPGQYRDLNPIFGEPPRRSLCKVQDQVNRAISGLVQWLNKKESGPLGSNPIIKAIMTHYYLAEIHAFGDGNGRTARAVEALVLYVNGINKYCFWSFAKFWNANRTEYIFRLGNIRGNCDPWSFIMWGIEGYLKEIQRIKEAVLKKAKQLMLMDYVRWLLATKKQHSNKRKINKRIEGLLALLIRTGKMNFAKFLGLPELATLYHKRTDSTRYRDFEKMAELNLIHISKEDNTIEPNYKLLDYLKYNVQKSKS